MLIYSMSVSVDGFITDRDGAFAWTAPSEELFRFRTLDSVQGNARLAEASLAAGPDRDQDFGSRVVFERYGRAGDESD